MNLQIASATAEGALITVAAVDCFALGISEFHVSTSLKRYSPNTVHCQQCPRQCEAPAGSGRGTGGIPAGTTPATAEGYCEAGARSGGTTLAVDRAVYLSIFWRDSHGTHGQRGQWPPRAYMRPREHSYVRGHYARSDPAAGLSRSGLIGSEVTRAYHGGVLIYPDAPE